MGIDESKPQSAVSIVVWNCNDLTHEVMDYLSLKDVSSISRICRGTSESIFTYQFKWNHVCNYDEFINYLERYKLLYKCRMITAGSRPLSRGNNYAKLLNLKFDAVNFRPSSDKSDDLIVPSCKRLTINDPNYLNYMHDKWGNSDGTFNTTILTIMNENKHQPNASINALQWASFVFVNVEKLNLINLDISHLEPAINCMSLNELSIEMLNWIDLGLLPKSLHKLKIGRLYSLSKIDLTFLINLEILAIGMGISITMSSNIRYTLPVGLQELMIPAQILHVNQKWPPLLNLPQLFIEDENPTLTSVYDSFHFTRPHIEASPSSRVLKCENNDVNEIKNTIQSIPDFQSKNFTLAFLK
jgi:hypothetical protein